MMELPNHDFSCIIVGVFLGVELQETDKIVQKVISDVELLFSNDILLVHFSQIGDLLCHHEVVNAHQQDAIAAQTLKLSLHVD